MSDVPVFRRRRGDVKGRLRSLKIHLWTDPLIYAQFSDLCVERGFSRDGGLERAFIMFIRRYKRALPPCQPQP